MSTTNRVKVRRWLPTREQAGLLQGTEATRPFLRDVPNDIRRCYAGRWIAVRDCQIIADAPTRAELSAKLGEPRDPAILVLRFGKGRRESRLCHRGNQI